VRSLDHSCFEIIGYRHVIIDPDFTTEPEPGVAYIYFTNGHQKVSLKKWEVSTVINHSPQLDETQISDSSKILFMLILLKKNQQNSKKCLFLRFLQKSIWIMGLDQ